MPFFRCEGGRVRAGLFAPFVAVGFTGEGWSCGQPFERAALEPIGQFGHKGTQHWKGEGGVVELICILLLGTPPPPFYRSLSHCTRDSRNLHTLLLPPPPN